INARVDTFLHGDGSVDDAVERANAYLSAGADCAYPIFCPTAAIAELAGRTDGPINVLITPETPGVAELAAFRLATATSAAGLAALAAAEAARLAGDATKDG